MDKYFKNSLELEIYNVGYYQEGESIVLFIKTDGIVVFCLVIDGYRVNNVNLSKKILIGKNIETVNMFCWSHPDLDHSLGVDDFIPFLSEESSIILSYGYEKSIDKWENANIKMNQMICKELGKRLSIKKRIDVRTVHEGMSLYQQKFVDVRNSFEYKCDISVFSPFSRMILNRVVNNKDIENNIMSVGLCVKIGEKSIVLCSDVPDVVFNNLREDDFPEFVDYLKIPHHGSINGSIVIRKIKNTPDIASMTVFTNNNLPNSEVIKEYRKKVNQVFCTNDLSKNKQDTFFGIHKCIYRIDKVDNKSNMVSNYLYGNATEIE